MPPRCRIAHHIEERSWRSTSPTGADRSRVDAGSASRPDTRSCMLQASLPVATPTTERRSSAGSATRRLTAALWSRPRARSRATEPRPRRPTGPTGWRLPAITPGRTARLGRWATSPSPGEVELWMFGASNVSGTRGSGVPKFPPSTLRAAARTPATHPASPSTNPPTTATHSASAPASRVRTGQRSTAKRPAKTEHRQQRRRARKRSGAHQRSRHAAAGSASVSPARRTRPAVVAAQPTAERTSSGSAGPLVVGLCLVLAVSGGAVWTVRRRRRYE